MDHTYETPEQNNIFSAEKFLCAPVRKNISYETETRLMQTDETPKSSREFFLKREIDSEFEEGEIDTKKIDNKYTEKAVSKRVYPRYWDTDVEEKHKTSKIVYVTPRTGPRSEIRFVENSPEFWTSGNVFSINDNILVKRHFSGLQDFVHIAKISSVSTQKFKFPTAGLEFILPRLQEIFDTVDEDENGELCYPGLEEETTYQQFALEDFWNSDLCIKFMKLKIRLFKTDYGRLAFRLLNEVPEKSKVLKFGTCVWHGPTATIGFEPFKQVFEILKTIQQQKSKNKNSF